ncbi:MAG: bacillithiol biosynthesis cysteine-adding enzyme BshC [Ignavibacteria bacterium]|nr:bacillithiol biosynthesis cysteine-adding enzyme BshC [Ignavibacteria bacterium]
MNWIDYRHLPPSSGGFSTLFFDYLHNFSSVRKFYVHDFRESDSYKTVIDDLLGREGDRSVLVEVLDEQNRAFRAGSKAFEHIGLLRKKTTYAVVTGQQVGIFGGPLYSVYKTITAIKLAENLKKKFPHYDFVPVFWVEGEDHDFAEMNNVGILAPDSKYVKVEYLPGGSMPERNMGPVGELVFDDHLQDTFAGLEAALQKTEFTAGVLERLRSSYAAGATFNSGFVSWMNALFEEWGVVFVSPHDPRLKRMMSPLFVKELSEFPHTSQLVIDRSAELEQSYHAQIKPKSINLFLFHKNGRYLIEPRENDFSLKGTRHYLSPEELLAIARETPEQLSPNVVLRPIAQDTILPTVAYVGGPSEIAYNAQLGPVYESFGIVRPVLYPRASASFAGERLERVREKYQLDHIDFFSNPDVITKRVLTQIAEVKLDELFDDSRARVREVYKELGFGLKEIDSTLLGALEGIVSKSDHNLDVLHEKAGAAQRRRNETVVRQIERASHEFLPGGTLQERGLSIVYFMNKYGPDLVRWFVDELDITTFKHQIMSL